MAQSRAFADDPRAAAAHQGRIRPSRTRRIVRRTLLAFGVLLAAFLIFVFIRVGPLFLVPNAYEGVPSIEAQSEYRDAKLMQSAWSLPVAAAYRRGGFEYQANPSFCGPTSLANVMRSLGRPTDQRKVIDGTRYEPWFGILVGGLTIDELASLTSERLGGGVQVVRDPTLAEFRMWMERANAPAHRIIVNFHRGPLFGRGHGHFSPVLGYLERDDLVLVGDTNDDYRPFLVSSERLWRGTDTIDQETEKERGLIVVRVAPVQERSKAPI